MKRHSVYVIVVVVFVVVFVVKFGWKSKGKWQWNGYDMSPSLSTHLYLTLDGLTWPIPLNLKEINHKCVNGVPILMLSVFVCLFVCFCSATCNFPRSWLLPVLKDNIKDTELKYFFDKMLPLSAKLRAKGRFWFMLSNWIYIYIYVYIYIYICIYIYIYICQCLYLYPRTHTHIHTEKKERKKETTKSAMQNLMNEPNAFMSLIILLKFFLPSVLPSFLPVIA